MEALRIRDNHMKFSTILNLELGETTALNYVSLEADLARGVTQDLAAGPGLQDLPDRTAGPAPGQGPAPGPALVLDPALALDPALVLAVVLLKRVTPTKATAPA